VSATCVRSPAAVELPNAAKGEVRVGDDAES